MPTIFHEMFCGGLLLEVRICPIYTVCLKGPHLGGHNTEERMASFLFWPNLWWSLERIREFQWGSHRNLLGLSHFVVAFLWHLLRCWYVSLAEPRFMEQGQYSPSPQTPDTSVHLPGSSTGAEGKNFVLVSWLFSSCFPWRWVRLTSWSERTGCGRNCWKFGFQQHNCWERLLPGRHSTFGCHSGFLG